MAFRDSNGRITIDEIAASKDVSVLNCSLESLTSVLDYLNQNIAEASELKGQTATAIVDTSNNMRTEILSLINEIQDTISLIKGTIIKYQNIDSQIKDTINSSI